MREDVELPKDRVSIILSTFGAQKAGNWDIGAWLASR